MKWIRSKLKHSNISNLCDSVIGCVSCWNTISPIQQSQWNELSLVKICLRAAQLVVRASVSYITADQITIRLHLTPRKSHTDCNLTNPSVWRRVQGRAVSLWQRSPDYRVVTGLCVKRDINRELVKAIFVVRFGPEVFGHWHSFFNHFVSVFHHNGFEIKESRCDQCADFQLEFKRSHKKVPFNV